MFHISDWVLSIVSGRYGSLGTMADTYRLFYNIFCISCNICTYGTVYFISWTKSTIISRSKESSKEKR